MTTFHFSTSMTSTKWFQEFEDSKKGMPLELVSAGGACVNVKKHYYRCEYEKPLSVILKLRIWNVTVATPSKHNDKKHDGSNQTPY